MRAYKRLLVCLVAVTFASSGLPCLAQNGDSATVVYKTRYTQLYRTHIEQPTDIPNLIALSDFYADSLNPLFNRPLAMHYISQADLYFTDLLQSGKRIREANRLIKKGVSVSLIREKKKRIVAGTMAYLQSAPPITRSEIDYYFKYFKQESAVKQQLSQMKVDAAYREAASNRGADGYYTFVENYSGTDEGDSAEATLVRLASRQFLQARTDAEIDAIAQRYSKSAAVQRAAEKQKGHLAYLKARDRHSADAYQDFLLRFPTADEYMKAIDMLDTIALEQFYLIHSAQGYVDFIREHDADPLAEKALQQLRERIEQHHDAGAAELYLENYPMDADHSLLYQLYYSWFAHEGNRTPIADFADRHRDYPFMESVRNDRANGVRIDAFDLMHPDNGMAAEDYASFIRMNMGKGITFVALQRMVQPNLDAKRWKAALKSLQDLSLCFEGDSEKEYLSLKAILEKADNASVTQENIRGSRCTPHPDGIHFLFCRNGQIYQGSMGGTDNAEPLPFADNGNRGLQLFSLYDRGTKMLVGRDGDIWTAHHDGVLWHIDKPLPSPINTPYIETDAYMLPDGSGMLFASDRPEGCNIQRSRINYHGDTALATDLYYVSCTAGQWGEPVHLDATVNTPYSERYPLMSRNGKTLYFVSDGHGGMGYGDIYRTTRLDGSWQRWSEPENLGKGVNSAHREGYLAFSSDESRLYFLSDRGTPTGYYSTATTHNRQRMATAGDDSDWALDNISFHSGDDGEYITHPGALPALVKYLTEHPEISIDIVSHHQHINADQGYHISLRRGETVRRYLTAHGVKRSRISVSAYGNTAGKAEHELSVRIIDRSAH